MSSVEPEPPLQSISVLQQNQLDEQIDAPLQDAEHVVWSRAAENTVEPSSDPSERPSRAIFAPDPSPMINAFDRVLPIPTFGADFRCRSAPAETSLAGHCSSSAYPSPIGSEENLWVRMCLALSCLQTLVDLVSSPLQRSDLHRRPFHSPLAPSLLPKLVTRSCVACRSVGQPTNRVRSPSGDLNLCCELRLTGIPANGPDADL